MSNALPAEFQELMGRTDGEPIEPPALQTVTSGDIFRAITAASVWIVEVEGRTDNGSVQGLLTRISEDPLKFLGIDLPDMHLLRVPAAIGGYLSDASSGLLIDAVMPNRSNCTRICTAGLISLTLFRSHARIDS